MTASENAWIGRRQRRSGEPGGRPGEFRIDPGAQQPKVTLISYDQKGLNECVLGDLDELAPLVQSNLVAWVNVEGLGSQEVLQEIARVFKVHPLALEDIVNVPQRPKVDAFDEALFVVAQVITRASRVEREQISLYLGEHFVVTFQERSGDPFDPIRKRLRNRRGRLRTRGADYLAYALLDAIIDQYFPAIESLQDSLESLESELRFPRADAIERIQRARTELGEAKQAIAPLREVMRSLLSGEWPQITEPTLMYLRDCRDHTLEAHEQLEACRELASGLMEIHLSTVSHQANQTMKVLTIIATIFMPLSFLAGIYGMNFDPGVSRWNMPELSAPFGYVSLIALMVVLGIGLVALFWRKGWFD